MKKITLFIIFLLSISGGFAQKIKYPKMVAYPLKDSIITLNSDSDYVKIYMVTPVAKEMVNTFPGMVSINCCNRRLAEMRIDLIEFDSLFTDIDVYRTDSTLTTISLFSYQYSYNSENFLLYQYSSKPAGIRQTLYLQISDSLWYFADYRQGLCSIMSSDTKLNEIMINLHPRKRYFRNSSIAVLGYYISTISRKDKFLKTSLEQLEMQNDPAIQFFK